MEDAGDLGRQEQLVVVHCLAAFHEVGDARGARLRAEDRRSYPFFVSGLGGSGELPVSILSTFSEFGTLCAQ